MNLFRTSATTRHIIEKTKDTVNITINSRRNIGTLLFIVLWLLIWIYMFIGISIPWSIMLLGATGIADPKLQGSPIFVVGFCAFSIFLLLMQFMGMFGIYTCLWELAGKELIMVNKDKIIVARQLFGWKREKEFPAENKDNLIVRNTSQSFFWNPFQKRYRYAFELSDERKTYRFGFLVKEEEAKEILSAIHAFISPTS